MGPIYDRGHTGWTDFRNASPPVCTFLSGGRVTGLEPATLTLARPVPLCMM
jgi:hypothetical protein